ncbi:hypothetical protein J6E39_08740 [bacterium]|nr:hypothetical protein [bacterium]
MFIEKYKVKNIKKGVFIFLLSIILSLIIYFNSNVFENRIIFLFVLGSISIIIFLVILYLNFLLQKQIGKYVELTNADYPDERILFSGKIVDIMFYKPYNRVCTIVDTKGFINTYSTQDRGDILVLFNRYQGDSLTNARIVNTFVPSNNIAITSEEPCLEYSDFMLFCDLKYKKFHKG